MDNPVSSEDRGNGGRDDQEQREPLKANLVLQGTITVPQPHQGRRRTEQNDANQRCGEPIFNRFSVIASFFVGVALIIVGALQFGVYSRQAEIMKDQTTLIRQQAQLSSNANEQNAIVNRAFVYPKEINFVGPRTGLTQNGEWNALITWENSGNTPTVDLHVAGNYTGKGVIQQWPQFPNFNGLEKHPFFLGPKATTFFSLRILPEHFEAIRAGTIFAFIFARATYKDAISGTEHLTRACWEFFRVPAGVDTQRQRSEMPECRIHNCTDEECGREDQLHPEAAPR